MTYSFNGKEVANKGALTSVTTSYFFGKKGVEGKIVKFIRQIKDGSYRPKGLGLNLSGNVSAEQLAANLAAQLPKFANQGQYSLSDKQLYRAAVSLLPTIKEMLSEAAQRRQAVALAKEAAIAQKRAQAAAYKAKRDAEAAKAKAAEQKKAAAIEKARQQELRKAKREMRFFL